MPRYGRDGQLETKIYVGDLPRDASEKDLERAFSYYGPLRNVWVARNPPGFAFIEFEDQRDADDAVRALDGTTVCGVRVRVEHSTGKVRPKPWMRPPPRNRKPFDANDRSRSRSRSRSVERGGARRSYSRSRSRSRSPSPRGSPRN